MEPVPAQLPLTGIRVLDCSRVLAGPFASMVLADLGAEVIKVEPPNGDETRYWGPPFWSDPAEGLSAYFVAVNRNKRSICIDLKTAEGRQVFDSLANRSDVLIHNFRPSTAVRLGLGVERLEAAHPNLITAAIGGFPGEAESDRPAYDLLAQAVSGLMWVTGPRGGEPNRVGVAVLDLIAGLYVAVAAVAAVLRRADSTTHVRASLVEVGLTSLVNVLANYLVTGEEPERYGSGHPNIAPYQSFQTNDGHVVVAVGNDAQFSALLTVLELVDEDKLFATNAARLKRRDTLVQWLGEAIRMRSRDELVSALSALDVPAGPVLPVGEAVANMQRAYGMEWLEHVQGMSLAPSPLMLNGQKLPVRSSPPRLGEHTDAILSDLGFTASAVVQLRTSGVVR